MQNNPRFLVVIETVSFATDAVFPIFAAINDHIIIGVANDQKRLLGTILQHSHFVSGEREPAHTLRHHAVLKHFHASLPLSLLAGPGELNHPFVEQLNRSVDFSVFHLCHHVFGGVVALEEGDLVFAVA